MFVRGVALIAALLLWTAGALAQPAGAHSEFRVKYVSTDSVYLDGGSEDGLAEGMELELERREAGAPQLAAETVGKVRIVALAAHSAACTVIDGAGAIQQGDVATLSTGDAEVARFLTTSGNSRSYAQVVTFTDMDFQDPLEEEQRAYVPRPPLPEINRIRGQVRVEHSSLLQQGGSTSHSTGLVVRADMTRIGGTFWNLRGYWRGRLQSRTSGVQQETLQDLLNRTYTMALTYENPFSKNVLGVGRLLLPWATSLSTLDGAYYGRRLNRTVTTGVFAGTAPDPTAWNFDPNRQIGGAFANFGAGSFEGVRYSGTYGAALTRRNWLAERQFLFMENSLSLEHQLSVYQSMEIDYRSKGRFGSETGGPVLSRSFLTLRLQPNRTVSFDLNHNYFRPVPTFDDRLIGIGLVDQLLFQGLSGGVRVRLPGNSAIYTNLGRSHRQSDAESSWNYQLGFTLGRIPWAGVRADVRASRFSSSFGSGRYYTGSLTKLLGDQLRIELQGGRQDIVSTVTRQSRAYWVNSNLEWTFGSHYVLGGGYSWYDGNVNRYSQLFFSLGYRFR